MVLVAAPAALGQQAAAPQAPATAEAGLVTLASRHAPAETIERFEAAVRAKGWTVFTRIDHAAAAEAAGQALRPRTVIVFGNPKVGTAPMRANPTLALDLPLRALVWQDDAGKVWLTYNSADYLGGQIYPRHGMAMGAEARAGMAQFLGDVSRQATE